jgi:hypothetical protein
MATVQNLHAGQTGSDLKDLHVSVAIQLGVLLAFVVSHSYSRRPQWLHRLCHHWYPGHKLKFRPNSLKRSKSPHIPTDQPHRPNTVQQCLPHPLRHGMSRLLPTLSQMPQAQTPLGRDQPYPQYTPKRSRRPTLPAGSLVRPKAPTGRSHTTLMCSLFQLGSK